jgi:hypothetical protein
MSSKPAQLVSLSARFAIVDSLLYWPKELVILIAEYSTPDRNDRLTMLMPGLKGQTVIVSILNDPSGTISIHWTHEHGYRQVFLRRNGFQSKPINVENNIMHLIEGRAMPYGAFKGCEERILSFFGSHVFQRRPPEYTLFLSKFAEKLAEIE